MVAAVLVQMVFSTDDITGCGNKPADVEFVLDSSGSIMFKDFRKQLQFTKNLVDLFDIGSNKTRVGMVSFSTEVIPEFTLDENNNKEDIKKKIAAVKYQGGRTNTGDALHYVRTKTFPLGGGRPNVPHITIVLTDGMSQNLSYTEQEAAAMHGQGITVFVIGIGNQVDEKELAAIASTPTDNFMFTIDNFDALQSIKDRLAIRTCKVPPATPAPPTPPAVNEDAVLYGNAHCGPEIPVELKVVFDTSAIGLDNSKFIMRFIADISDRLDLRQSQSEVGTVTNDCAAKSLADVSFGSGHDREKLEQSLVGTSPSFSWMVRKLRLSFNQQEKRKKLAVVFLGDTLDRAEFLKVLRETGRAKFMGIQILVVGVGARVNTRQASFLATQANQIFFAMSYDNLDDLEGPLLLQICTLK